ncbi:hypothetical protein FRC00_005026, partial [Tulasnella sp. 408]
MAPVQSKLVGRQHAIASAGTVAPAESSRKASLRSTRQLTAKQQQLEEEKAAESNKVQPKKHPAVRSRKANRQPNGEVGDETFTVVRHTEATATSSRGRSTHRRGGNRTNPPTRDPSPLPTDTRPYHRTAGHGRRSVSASPPTMNTQEPRRASPEPVSRQPVHRNIANSEDEDGESLRPVMPPNFRGRFRDHEDENEDVDENGIEDEDEGLGSLASHRGFVFDGDEMVDTEGSFGNGSGSNRGTAREEPEQEQAATSEDEVEPMEYTPSPSGNERALHSKRLASASPEDSRRAKRNTANTNSARPKASDFPPDAKSAILSACSKFKALLASNGSFMDSLTENTCVAEAFQWGCNDCGVSLTLAKEHAIVSQIRKGASQMRGELKIIARAAVEAVFGFVSRDSKTLTNKRLYDQLIHENLFLYEKWQNPAKPEGMWYGEILFKIVRKMWFANSKDNGIVHSSHFNPIQPETIALVWTAVRCALDEWKDGVFIPVNFTALSYETMYQELFCGLESLQGTSDGQAVVRDLGVELWEESSNGFVERRQHTHNTFTQTQHAAAVRDAAARKARKQAEAEANAAALTDY